ncbi:MAG: MMPL family transporter, partial [Actinomycetota bacterium]
DVESPDGLAAIGAVHDGLAARQDVVADSTVSVASLFGGEADGAPTTSAQVADLTTIVAADPVLAGNVLFADEPGAALFVAITGKEHATDVAAAAEELIANQPALAGTEVAVAGQPLAEDAFGQQMFIQMAIFAPLAGAAVFLILWLYFRRLQFVLPAMALAMATVIITMGLLVGSGNTLHIMTSMIPIFLMPIAILDSVHVLSEFFDRYNSTNAAERDRETTINAVIDELARPIGYTSLTTGVGFAALLLVPIPPVRLFGLFVAIGVGLAWLLTLTLLPALLILVNQDRLIVDRAATAGGRLPALGRRVVTARRPILAVVLLSAVTAVPALMTVTVNDNPVRWFRADHEVRQATEQLGRALPGTFTASLVVTETEPGALDRPETMSAIDALAVRLAEQPEVGAVQTYVDSTHPILRSGPVANVRLQLKTGDNTAMSSVTDAADVALADRPIPGVSTAWAGEAYLNLTWQQKMVSGMLVGFATTLVAIFVLLVALFRSLRWALAAMVPVLWTVLIVYAGLAALGRDFDMPVAVLSTMVLGIGVDFAIHFVERYRAIRSTVGSATEAAARFYGEPATALTRNAVVIAIGFAPLLLSSLVPYVVVGALLASIVGLSWLASLVVLPALAVGSSQPTKNLGAQPAELVGDEPKFRRGGARTEDRRSGSAPALTGRGTR